MARHLEESGRRVHGVDRVDAYDVDRRYHDQVRLVVHAVDQGRQTWLLVCGLILPPEVVQTIIGWVSICLVQAEEKLCVLCHPLLELLDWHHQRMPTQGVVKVLGAIAEQWERGGHAREELGAVKVTPEKGDVADAYLPAASLLRASALACNSIQRDQLRRLIPREPPACVMHFPCVQVVRDPELDLL